MKLFSQSPNKIDLLLKGTTSIPVIFVWEFTPLPSGLQDKHELQDKHANLTAKTKISGK